MKWYENYGDSEFFGVMIYEGIETGCVRRDE